MRRVDLPDICSRTLFKACAERIQSQTDREALLARVEEIDELVGKYVDAAEKNQLANFSPLKEFWGVPKKTWSYLYKHHLRDGSCRNEYDLVLLASDRICPFCSVQTVYEVDHFLPKSKFPQFAVLPANLVPSCRDCNKAKDAGCPSEPADQLFHPYFETVGGRWLTVEVHENTPPSVTYEVSGLASLIGVRLKRTQNQFRILDLGLVYSVLAANEMSSVDWDLSKIHDGGGPREVKQHLENQSKSSEESEYPVEWKVALYEGLSRSEWYCDGGFKFR